MSCHCGKPTTAKGLCHSHYYEEYRKTHRKEYVEYSKVWKQKNKDKIKAINAVRRKRYKGYSSSVTRNEVLELLKTQTQCPACTREFSEEVMATLDHKTPLIRGGAHEADNLHLLCRSCNCSKGAKTWTEFLHHRSAQPLI